MPDSVLLIEPDPAYQAQLRGTLLNSGVPTLAVGDAFEAISALGRAKFTALILPRVLLGVDGKSLVALALLRHSEITVFSSLPASERDYDAVHLPAEAPRIVSGTVLASLRQRDTAAVPAPFDFATPATIALQGQLAAGDAAPLLAGLFAQEMSGLLMLSSPATTLYFFAGEPVWAKPAQGDRTLLEKLHHSGALKDISRFTKLREGSLLSTLASEKELSGDELHAFTVAHVRDSVLALLLEGKGKWRFDEDTSFQKSVPLARINPFALMLQARQRRTSPAELPVIADALGPQFLSRGPGPKKAFDRIKPFLRGVDLRRFLREGRTASAFFEESGLDATFGVLVILTLQDARMVVLTDHKPGQNSVALSESGDFDTQPQQTEDLLLPSAEVEMAQKDESAESSFARNVLLALYMQIKTAESAPEMFRVDAQASVEEIDAAYAALMAQLDPTTIPKGPSHQLMVGRIQELRKKLREGYQELILAAPAR